jgi:hypothetical protein
MRCNPTAAQAFVQIAKLQGPVAARQPIFCSVRFYIYVNTLPNVQTVIYTGGNDSVSFFQDLLLNPDGSLVLEDGVGVTVSSSPLTLTTGVWHQISLSVNPNTNVTTGGSSGANWISLYVDGVFWAYLQSTPTNTIVYTFAQIGVGMASTPCTCDIYFDDVIWDSGANGGVVIGPGQQVILKPTADSAIGNWTAGSGGVTNLWQAVDNIPPVGLAPASETNTSQIHNSSATVPSDYTATCQSYTVAGIPANSFINAVVAVDNEGVESTAGPSLFGFLWVASNPVQPIPSDPIFEFGFGSLGSVVVSTFPTAWFTDEGPVTTNPSVVLGTPPTVSVRKLTSTTTPAAVDFLGIYVDYLAPVVSTFVPIWQMPFLPGFGNGR